MNDPLMKIYLICTPCALLCLQLCENKWDLVWKVNCQLLSDLEGFVLAFPGKTGKSICINAHLAACLALLNLEVDLVILCRHIHFPGCLHWKQRFYKYDSFSSYSAPISWPPILVQLSKAACFLMLKVLFGGHCFFASSYNFQKECSVLIIQFRLTSNTFEIFPWGTCSWNKQFEKVLYRGLILTHHVRHFCIEETQTVFLAS